jgi:hypothetical protein
VGGAAASASITRGTASDGYTTVVVSGNLSSSTPDLELSATATIDNTAIEATTGQRRIK